MVGRSGSGSISVLMMMLAACTPFAGATTELDGGANANGTDAGSASGEAGVAPDAASLAGAAPTCSGETCGNRSSCSSFDFEGACPEDWTLSGDSSPNVTRECKDGKLHIAADGTLDVTASLDIDVPSGASKSRVSVLAAAKRWDGRSFLHLRVGDEKLFEIRAEQLGSDTIRYRLCEDASCTTGVTFEAAAGQERRLTFDVTETVITLSVDCESYPPRPRPETDSESNKATLVFGHTDAEPIDGTIDDVLIDFE